MLVDPLKSLDWEGRGAEFHSKASPHITAKVCQCLAVLLQSSIR